ncbi:hypothetical protein PSACC_02503 [Paramicrosporidium saccamoebae]|uniref:Uncharacterized protein n=1 Tax=Paramicrosporidium saccamoebae TaxID=1246581 RepID=A0A2H9TIV1_9FUNG|nr:hypothetical protein PSACC_02503 [Paramicrosporidium saccamoebae]
MQVTSGYAWRNLTASSLYAALSFYLFCLSGFEILAWSGEWRLRGKWTCFIVPYIALLAILKYRAAHHRKIRKHQDPGCTTDDSDKNSSRLPMYLQEAFYSKAKMSSIYLRAFNEYWNLACYSVVWMLFPKHIALVYLLTVWVSIVVQTIMVGIHWYALTGADYLVYNGRRYTIYVLGMSVSLLKDEEGKVLCYPTLDLHGLIRSDT